MDVTKYQLKLFFDAGSGICLWAGDEKTETKFGDYPIDPKLLPISENLRYKLYYLCAWYDTSINWTYPSDPSPWSDKERTRFYYQVDITVKALKKEMSNEYSIICSEHIKSQANSYE